MRIGNHLCGGANLANGRFLKKAPCRASPMPENWSLRNKPEQLLPESQPQANRRRTVLFTEEFIVVRKFFGGRAQLRRCNPCQTAQNSRRTGDENDASQFQVKD